MSEEASAMRKRTKITAASICLCALLLPCGCAQLKPRPTGPPTAALPPSPATTLAQLFAPVLAEHPFETGLVPLDTGRESLTARVALCDLAERSLDIQSYVWSADTVGRVIWEHARRAADRGVRVRILVDDMTLGGRHVEALVHPNIEVRIMNPFKHRKSGRLLELLQRFGRLNHRMHNKLFIVDNQVAFVGGRNLADEYFGLNARFNFRDLDVFAVGPAVEQASSSFDDYWNSALAYPVGLLGHGSAKELAQFLPEAEAKVKEAVRQCPYRVELERDKVLAVLRAHAQSMFWGRARVVWDDPARLTGLGGLPPGGPSLAVTELAQAAQRDILVEAAYFVPDRSMRLIGPLLRRGITMRVLTNSLGSTDLVAVHAFYSTTRRSLLERGAHLFELRPDAALREAHAARPWTTKLALHAKVAVFDQETVVIGSFNLDPRSRYLNTEVVLIAENPALAQRIAGIMENDRRPENSWSLALGPRGGVTWREQRDGHEQRTGFQPGGFWRQLREIIVALLPVHQQT
jgi:putative cardiolipin synthase